MKSINARFIANFIMSGQKEKKAHFRNTGQVTRVSALNTI